MQMISTVTSKGQVVIPVPIRNKLNIKPFDRVTFDVLGQMIIAEKASTTEEMYGFINSKKSLTNEQLEKAISKAMEEEMSDDL